ncbi:MAG: HAMP domain-containing histidine kinase [Flavobacteriaceae bacterium]|nr:HAMP domain-containing histidine kinase [Flavobacteriaceae bacterium]
MKLLNKSITYLSLSILGIVTLWAVIFYVSMLQEIKSSIDEGLENYKRLIIQNADNDPSILTKNYFDESFFTIHPMDKGEALAFKDQYLDTIIDMQDADDETLEPEPVRMLVSAFESNGKFYRLKVANSMVEEDDLINELLWDVVWLYIVLIIGVLVINNIVLKKLWHPFYSLLEQLKSFRLGTSHKLVRTNSTVKEFMDLQKSMNHLLQENINAFERQKEFVGNASHELQTPLAIMTNKLELLLENVALNDKEAENLTEIYQIVQRLIRLNNSLLLLTKIENKQFFENGLVSINETVHQSVEDLEDMAAFRKIKITVSESSLLETNMDIALANILIGNLVKNAIHHTTATGNINIHITASKLQVQNTAVDGPLADGLIFSRFYGSRKETGRSGLGLSIVKAIADLYGFRVQYGFDDVMHSFEIFFSPIPPSKG